MGLRIGIDVGGTFTDFFLVEDGAQPVIHKVLSTPDDPSIAVARGLEEIAQARHPVQSLNEFASAIDVIVHGTTVTTNATLTRRGAKTGLLTTAGLRDALEMRRGIREEQYNNRYTNVPPLIPRYLRHGITGRLDRHGAEVTALDLDEIKSAIEHFKAEEVDAVAICFMNAFADAGHEQQAAELVRRQMPEAYLTVSTELLPCIRFYDRVSTTALNSYIGPILDHYLERLQHRLKEAGFAGVLLIMQSNGGVMAPEISRRSAAMTLLSGPAGGPVAGLYYAAGHGLDNCITIDMGGTSFEACLVTGQPVTVTDGAIDRLRIALPMLDINTIGAGGGSIAWLDEGGILRSGPESAGAQPGPACYGLGGSEPTTTDANLVLGYLNPDFFAGGSIKLDLAAARAAIEEKIAKPMGLGIEAAAAGIYRVACTNMAQGVREVSVKRGNDPREFPLVVAGGAGPTHACLICDELEIPLQIIPRECSVLCAAGMLMGDLKHDFVRTFVGRLESLDWTRMLREFETMRAEGDGLLESEGIAEAARDHLIRLDCRYLQQYHEVSFAVPWAAIEAGDGAAVAAAFHDEHNRLYGYSLIEEAAPIEVINIRLQCLGKTAKPVLGDMPYAGTDAAAARKGERRIYDYLENEFTSAPIYDGDALKYGNRIAGPAIIEAVTTAIFVAPGHALVTDRHGTFAVYRQGREDLVRESLEGAA